MFEFGRELRRVFGADGLNGPVARTEVLELLDLSLLRREAAAAGTAAARAGSGERAARWAEAAALHREIARRTGEAESLRRSGSAAEISWKAAGGDRRRLGEARLEQGLTALVGADLFGDPALMRSAREYLTDALAEAGTEPGPRARAQAA
ncbi:MAG: hypothetical protein KY449_08685, partial [Proteobacteria bacterium]|nr:hypothetical protein [Pseudomonadota bacterium]